MDVVEFFDKNPDIFIRKPALVEGSLFSLEYSKKREPFDSKWGKWLCECFNCNKVLNFFICYDKNKNVFHVFEKKSKKKNIFSDFKKGRLIKLLTEEHFVIISKDSLNSLVNNKIRDVTTRIRYKVFTRDNFTCQKCGDKGQRIGGKAILCIDHILPIYYGGSNNFNNLQTLCLWCNIKKHTKIEEEYFYAEITKNK